MRNFSYDADEKLRGTEEYDFKRKRDKQNFIEYRHMKISNMNTKINLR